MDDNKLELVVLNYSCGEIKTVYGYYPGESELFFKIYREMGDDYKYVSYGEIPSLNVKISGSSIDEIIGVLRDEYNMPIPDREKLGKRGIFWKKYYSQKLIAYKCRRDIISSIVAHRRIDSVCTKLVIEKSGPIDDSNRWYLSVNNQKIGPFESYCDDELVQVLKEYDIVLPEEDTLIENALLDKNK